MLNPTETRTWRDKWWVKYILAEIPIIGGFFSKKPRMEALHDAGKCVTTLICSTGTMMTVLPMHKDDAFLIASLKMLTSMAIGSTAGKALYNGACKSVEMLCQYHHTRNQLTNHFPLPTDDIELRQQQTLMRASSDSSTDNSASPANV